jgi:hypothetical protein
MPTLMTTLLGITLRPPLTWPSSLPDESEKSTFSERCSDTKKKKRREVAEVKQNDSRFEADLWLKLT